MAANLPLTTKYDRKRCRSMFWLGTCTNISRVPVLLWFHITLLISSNISVILWAYVINNVTYIVTWVYIKESRIHSVIYYSHIFGFNSDIIRFTLVISLYMRSKWIPFMQSLICFKITYIFLIIVPRLKSCNNLWIFQLLWFCAIFRKLYSNSSSFPLLLLDRVPFCL